jgi:hypothetical protein
VARRWGFGTGGRRGRGYENGDDCGTDHERERPPAADDRFSGRLTELRRQDDPHNYAGGEFVWRLYYRQGDRGDIEVRGVDNSPVIRLDAGGHSITLTYPRLRGATGDLDARLDVRVEIDGDDTRWTATLASDDRITLDELHFPPIGNAQLRNDEG